MKLGLFLKDRLYIIIIFIAFYVVNLLFLLASKVDLFLILFFSITLFSIIACVILIEYKRRKDFYDTLITNTEKLDKAYLVLETISYPNFYEGELLYNNLYEINKSMSENVGSLKKQVDDFKEYVEMWIHEVKIPIASLSLLLYNNKNLYDKKTMKIVSQIDNYVEQVLYYTRCENLEKDYLIKRTSLAKVLANVAIRNKDDLLENEIDLEIDDRGISVLSDSKWLEFILNQIVNNCIKYKDSNKESHIKIWVVDTKNKTNLFIEDNGIGIDDGDIDRVFDKAFTGVNGRKYSKSTGMGLFIVKNLITKLGHGIEIESKKGNYTRVTIAFYKNSFYDVVH